MSRTAIWRTRRRERKRFRGWETVDAIWQNGVESAGSATQTASDVPECFGIPAALKARICMLDILILKAITKL